MNLLASCNIHIIETITKTKDHYKETEFRHKGNLKAFVKDPETKSFLNEFPYDETYSLVEKAEDIIKAKSPSELAGEFAAKTIRGMMEEDKEDNKLSIDKIEEKIAQKEYEIKKKIKKIYQV